MKETRTKTSKKERRKQSRAFANVDPTEKLMLIGSEVFSPQIPDLPVETQAVNYTDN